MEAACWGIRQWVELWPDQYQSKGLFSAVSDHDLKLGPAFLIKTQTKTRPNKLQMTGSEPENRKSRKRAGKIKMMSNICFDPKIFCVQSRVRIYVFNLLHITWFFITLFSLLISGLCNPGQWAWVQHCHRGWRVCWTVNSIRRSYHPSWFHYQTVSAAGDGNSLFYFLLTSICTGSLIERRDSFLRETCFRGTKI